MAKSALKHAKRTPKVSFAGEMDQKCFKHLRKQKQLKVPKTDQNFFTWWNEPFSLQMAKSALKHIKTVQNTKALKHIKTAQNTKSIICWWNWAISSKKCLKHLKTAQNIKSFISVVMRHLISKQKHQKFHLLVKWTKSASNTSKHQKLHFLVKWAKFETKNS